MTDKKGSLIFGFAFFKSNWRWMLIVIFFILAIASVHRQPFKKTYITSDGHAYYAHLPAVFIYKDLQFSFIDEVKNSGAPHTGNIYEFRINTDKGVVNIAYLGVSILWVPAFLTAHIIALIGPAEASGYSTPYQVAILISAIAYLILGLWAFGRFLENLKIKPWIISVCLLLMTFATSTFYYTVDEPSFTHVYTMSLFAVFMLYVQRFFQTYQLKYLYIWFITLGLLGLIRPTNVVMIFIIPMIAGSGKETIRFFRWLVINFLKVLPALFIMLFVLFLQPLIYYLQTGSFFVWSYQGGSFNFLNPEITNVLFSYEKGLFIYAPILIFFIFGIWPLFKNNRYFLFWLLISIAVPTYVIASWWNWWYGMSFGHRAFIDYYPLFFISIAFGIQHIRNNFALNFLMVVALMCIGLNHIYMKQYKNYIFYWKMDKDKYWRVFLHTTEPYMGLFWEEEKYQYTLTNLNNEFPVTKASYNIGFEEQNERENIIPARGMAHTGIFSASIPAEQEYSTLIRFQIPDSLSMQKIALLSQVFVRPVSNPIKKELLFVLEIWRDGQVVHSQQSTSRTYNHFADQWNRLYLVHTEGFYFMSGDTVFFYLYNPFQNTVYLDDFTLYLFCEN